LKQQAQAHHDWLLVEEDECWFSRFAQPQAHVWAEVGTPLRLIQQEPPRNESEKALACFGAVRQDTSDVLLYFSDGQPTSLQMWLFIIGLLAVARAEGKQVLVIIWDNATWHKSRDLRIWIRAYNRAAKAFGQPRLLTHLLPVKSPWLNPIEPRWVHAKRAVCEPSITLTAAQLRQRLCAHFDTKSLFDSFKL
jgi:transposase